MKQLLLAFLLFGIGALLYSQTYQITFAAQGSATTVDEVIATNLSTDESVTLPGSETLTLQPVATNVENILENGNAAIFSNRQRGYSVVQLTSQANQNVNIHIIALDGRIVATCHRAIGPGTHRFKLTCETQGVYIANISTGSGQVGLKFCQGKALDNSINYIGVSENSQVLKSAGADNVLQYSADDYISYSISSGDLTTMVVECPAGDKKITADMVECVDGDGNNYPVVKIGTQTWMAKNINTSKYMDGTTIPYMSTKEDWAAIPDNNSGRGYGYIREEDADLYGALYTYGSAVKGTQFSGSHIQGVCPNGWHIPSDAEWKTLANYLGGTYYAGDKLKSKGVTLWKESPNSVGDNSSGFDALPGGYRRAYDGASVSIGYYANWWSSNQYNATYGYYCRLAYSSSNVSLSYFEKTYGFYVRCLKD